MGDNAESIRLLPSDNPLSYLAECAAGSHHWLQTAQSGKFMCSTCGTFSFCLYCPRVHVPEGAIVRTCRYHRHTGKHVNDIQNEITALSVLRRIR